MEILPVPALALREKGVKYLVKNEIRIWNGREFYCQHKKQRSRCKICCPEGYKKLLERNKARRRERRKIDPEYRERENELERKRREDPVIRERGRMQQRTPEYRIKVNARRRERRKIDPDYAYMCSQRARLWAFYKGKDKSASTKELLCCDQEFLKKHLESYFYGGMTVSKYKK